jgi:hypothetical protein
MVLKGKRFSLYTVFVLLVAIIVPSACSNPLADVVIAIKSAAVWPKVVPTSSAANHQVTLTWPDAAGATSYNLYWSTSRWKEPRASWSCRLSKQWLCQQVIQFILLGRIINGNTFSRAPYSVTEDTILIQNIIYVVNIHFLNTSRRPETHSASWVKSVIAKAIFIEAFNLQISCRY